MQISVIVPAYNCVSTIDKCIEALARERETLEILVIDDASTDDTASLATHAGAAVLSMPQQSGPAAARNYGAEKARGDVLFFVDADVVVAPGSLARVAQNLASGADAVFGSYDAAPAHPSWVSQYRNLLHHHTHQLADGPAQSFWSGCGAVTRAAFMQTGGFDARRYPRPSVEDIDLGYRLTQSGYHIRLDKDLQAKHLKRWTYLNMVQTDIFARAIPWTRLMIRHRPHQALNTRPSQQLAIILTLLLPVSLGLALFWPAVLVLSATLICAIIALNGSFFKLLLRKRGIAFALACAGLHLTHYACAALGFAYAQSERLVRKRGPTTF